MQAPLQRIHRTALHAAVCRLHTVFDRNQTLGILGRNAEHAGQPAPQHRARPAEEYRCTYTDDVPRADGGCQRGGERLKLADISR